MHEFVLDGETVKLRAEFRGFEGGHIDPNSITLTIKNSIREVLLEEDINENHRVSAGIYCFEYVVPIDTRGELTYEFKGMINGSPVVIRDIVEVVDGLENVTQPTLYGI